MGNTCGNCFRETLTGQGICTACGFDSGANREKYPLALAPGSILNGRYIIGRVLGQGGFGITYTAKDHQTGQIMAIKEFFPDSMATRTSHTTVTPLTGEKGENFAYGKNTFLNEAKTMAEFIGNPNIVRVYSYFEENGTGYFVMEYVDGRSFQDILKENFGRVSWEEALKILLPVMDALSAVHEKGIIHRDIAPDNICIAKDGTVKLLDFGAARYSLGNVSQSLDVVLRHGFAPKEQYKRHGRQGPYTDIYALGATLYYAITGSRPDDAIERLDEDTLPLPSTLGANVEPWQEDVILKAMAIQPEDRYQSVKDFKAALTGHTPRPAPKPVPNKEQKPAPRPEPKPEPVPVPVPKAKLPKWLIPAGAAAVLVLGVLLGTALGGDKEEKKLEVPATKAPAVEAVKMEPSVITTHVMVKDGRKSPASSGFWGQREYSTGDVETIRFQSTKEGAPINAWDVSEACDRSILAWMEDGNLIVAANGRIAPNPDAQYMFCNMYNLKEIDFGGCFDTSGVTNMQEMFRSCSELTSLDLSVFDTSNVTNMHSMFYGCSELSGLDLSTFDTSNVKSMGKMFEGCESLKILDISNFDTSSVTNLNCMFWKCKSLEELDLSGFDTSSATDMGMMFAECEALRNIEISGFDTSKVKSMNAMFNKCHALMEVNLSGFETVNVTDMSFMFSYCYALKELDLSGFDTKNVKDMTCMFAECSGLAELNISGFDSSGVEKMSSMFHKCSSLEELVCSDQPILSQYDWYQRTAS